MTKFLQAAFLLSVISFIFFFTDPAVSAQDTHGDHGASSLLTLAFFTVNFILFALLIRKFTGQLIKKKLRERRATIVKALDEAEAARVAAEKLRAEYAQRLTSLSTEEEALRNQAVEAAERERRRLMTEATAFAARAKQEAELIAQREVEEARLRIRQEISAQAIALAATLIRGNITNSDTNNLVNKLVKEVVDGRNTDS